MLRRLAPAIIATLVISMVQTSVIASPSVRQSAPSAYADLGNCDEAATEKFQGGSETDVVSTTRGVVTRAYLKLPDLCNNPDLSASGSAAWVALHRYEPQYADVWFQVGAVRRVGDTCLHFFMQYNPLSGGTITDYSIGCAATITWYRFVLKKHDANPDDWWQAYVLLDSNGVLQWDAPNAPISIDFYPDGAQLASEVRNGGHDQSGGGVASRLTFDGGAWWRSNWIAVTINMQGNERFCLLCGPSVPPGPNGPYNTQWYDGNTFEVWTDGF
jgi:hypothetical protein